GGGGGRGGGGGGAAGGACGPPLPVRLEVHRQERQVAGDVDPAQAGVELHSVHNRQRRAGQHVLAAQIAVPIAREPERRTAAQLGRVSLDEGIGEGAHDVQA